MGEVQPARPSTGRGGGGTPYREVVTLAHYAAGEAAHELNGRLILNGAGPLRELGLLDAVDVAYWHLIGERHGQDRENVIALIEGREPRIIDEEGRAEVTPQEALRAPDRMEALNEMRASMGMNPVERPSSLDGQPAPAEPKGPKMPSDPSLRGEMDLLAQMRERMGAAKHP